MHVFHEKLLSPQSVRFCVFIVGAVQVNSSQLHHHGTTARKARGNMPSQKKKKKNYLFYTGNSKTAKTSKLRLEITLSHTKHCLICNLRPLETPATTGPVHTEVIAYALNSFASVCLTHIFKILHWFSFGCHSQLYETDVLLIQEEGI